MSSPPDLEPVYLITGSDEPKVELAVSRLRARFVPEAVERASALEVTGEDAVALCNAGSLFGEARLVLVDAIDGRPNSEGRLTGCQCSDRAGGPMSERPEGMSFSLWEKVARRAG